MTSEPRQGEPAICADDECGVYEATFCVGFVTVVVSSVWQLKGKQNMQEHVTRGL